MAKRETGFETRLTLERVCCRPNNGSAIATSSSPTISLTGSRLSSDGAAGHRLRSTSGGSTSTISAASTRSTRPTSRRPRRPGPSLAPRSTLQSPTSATTGGQARSGPSISPSCGKRPYVYPTLNRGLRKGVSHADGNACLQTKGTWEEQQKMDQLRKAYQRAIQAPINNVESIWQEYNAFENNLGKLTVRPRFLLHAAKVPKTDPSSSH